MEERVIDLESRFAFQEEAIDELTRTVLGLRKELDQMTLEIERLKQQLKEAAPSAVVPQEQEPLPPHY